jgi:hypothetical protein
MITPPHTKQNHGISNTMTLWTLMSSYLVYGPLFARLKMRAPSKYHGRHRGGLALSNSTNRPSRNAKTAMKTSVFAF